MADKNMYRYGMYGAPHPKTGWGDVVVVGDLQNGKIAE
jgi:hypothetical protein